MSNVEEAALNECNREPVHIPGTIQPTGCVLVCDKAMRSVTHASANTAEFLGHDARELLGRPVTGVLDVDTMHRLRNITNMASIRETREPVGMFDGKSGLLAVSAFQTDDNIVLEFEPSGDAPWSDIEVAREITRLLDQINTQTSVDDMLANSVKWLSRVSGFDRVMVYRFDTDGAGEVIAEEKTPETVSFLGLRFPKWDIPTQARAIMSRVPLRMITDVNQTAVPLLSGASDGPDVDLTLGLLRGVSSVHMEYLRNMGVEASMTLSITIEGHLWGLIAFHHETPRTASPRVRALCLPFIEFLSVKIALLLQSQASRCRDQIKQLQLDIREIHGDGVDIEQIILGDPTSLMEHFNADGMLIRIGEEYHNFGVVLSSTVLDPLVNSAKRAGQIASYENLTKEAALSPRFLQNIGGALIVPFNGDDFAVIFRKKIERKMNWAGAPDKKIIEDGATLRLSPRGSFALYTETVKDHCEPWRDIDFELAKGLSTIVLQTASQRARLERDYFEDRVRQQTLMIGELNHRVRNILTLIRSVAREAQRDNQTLDGYALALEKRINALAFAHDLSTGDASPVVSILELIHSETRPFLQDNTSRLRVHGQDANILTDLCSVFVLAIHEMTTNARKYGALSNADGVIDIGLHESDGGIHLSWRESGGPPVSAPTESGFGKTLIEKAIPYELGGRVALNFDPEGVTVDIWMPNHVIDGEPIAVIGEQAFGNFENDTAPEDHAAVDIEIAGDVVALLVEDNFVISMDMEKALTRAGCANVRATGNVADAIKLINRGIIDIAVLDMHLGAENSFPIARRLRDLGIPFIFATGYGSNLLRPKELNDVPILTKPVEAQELKKALVAMIKTTKQAGKRAG